QDGTKPSDLWKRFPPAPLLAVGGRPDLASLFEFLSEFQTKEQWQGLQEALNKTLGAALGKDLVREVLPFVGPDWGLCVVAPPGDDKFGYPWLVAALRVEQGDRTAPVDRALLNALNSFAAFATNRFNQPKQARMAPPPPPGEKRGVPLPPPRPRFQPAFGLCHGYLVIASSPEAFRHFASLPVSPLPEGPEVPLFRLSVKAWHQYLEAHRKTVLADIAERNQITPEEAGRRLDGLLSVLPLFDRVEVTHRARKGLCTWTLRLQPTHPFCKP